MLRSSWEVVMARQRTRIRLLSLLFVVALLGGMTALGPPPAAASTRAASTQAASSGAAALAAVSSGPPTVTRVDSWVTVTPDANGRARIPYCPAATPCAFATAPPAVVVTGRSPTGGGPPVPANLIAYGQTTTGFTLLAYDQTGALITTSIDVNYHAASDLTANEEIRTVSATTDASGYATISFASARSVAPVAVVASGASPTSGTNIPVSLVVSARTATGFTVRAINQTGAAIASSSISLAYYAAWAGSITLPGGGVAANATSAVTTDASGYATVSFAQALPAAPTGIVAVGVAPASGGSIAASLIAYNPTTTGFRVRVLNQTGALVANTSVTLAYHAVTGTRSTTTLTLAPPRLVRSNGAALEWARAAGASFGRYEVHRSTTWGFAPSAATLLGTSSDPTASTWQDSTAAVSKTYYYKVVGDTTVSNQVTVATPANNLARLTLQPDADAGKATYMVQDRSTPSGCYDWYNYGAAANLRVGSAANGVRHRPLLAFDLRDVPAGASVSSASMTLWYPSSSAPTNLTNRQINLHRVTRAWTEGSGTYPGQCNGSGADWNETQGGVHWGAGGADYDATADASVGPKSHATSNGLPGADSFTVTSLVQEWVNGTPNHGVLLKLGDDATIPTDNPYFDYYPDDAADASWRPRLTVTYNDGSASVAPRVAVSSPAPGATVSGTTVALRAAAGDDGRITGVDFLVDGVVKASDTSAPFEGTWDSTTASKGSHTITVQASDEAGNPAVTSAGVQVTVDNTGGPTGQVTAPSAGAVVSGSAVTLSASATGNGDAVKQVEFLVDGDRVGAPDTSFPYSVTWDTLAPLQPAFDGAHQVQALVTETSGQQYLTPATTVTVDNVGASEFSADFKLNDPATTADDEMPQAMPANTSSTAPLQDPYAGTTNPDGTSGGSLDWSLKNAPTDSTGATVATTAGPTAAETTTATTCPVDAYCPTVTITNTSHVAWKNNTGLDLRVWYCWYAPNGAVLFEGPANDAFPNNFLPDQTKTFPLVIQPPRLPPGAELGQYRLRVDLYDVAMGSWFAAQGNPPIDNPVIVAKHLDHKLGLERFWQYDGEAIGAGMSTLTNVANGNMLLRWSPLFAPGRGLSTMLDLTYNSLEDHSESPAGNNFSLAVSGLTRFGDPLDIHPNKADDISGKSNKFVEFVDGDGTLHHFTGTTLADGSTRWQEPPGVNLYLRSIASNPADRRWALTRPDNVTFWFRDDGFPTAVTDRNGNTITYTLEQTPPGEDPGGPKWRITRITDPGGRAFTVVYWSRDEAKKAHVRGKIKRITDHDGSALDFDYYDDGNLLRLTQRGGTTADGSFLADRSFVFTYTTSAGDGPAISDPALRVNPDPKTANQSPRIFSVRDPRGVAAGTAGAGETTFTYYGPSDGAQLRWKLHTRTNRNGNTDQNRNLNPNPFTTSFDYNPATQVTTVTAPPLSAPRATSYTYDTDGKVTQLTDPLGRPTQVDWTGDFKVSQVTEPTGKFSTYTYNANGYLTSKTNQTRTETTQLTYLDSPVDAADAGNHLSLLSTVTRPKGVATGTVGDFQWRYSYDSAGNVNTVTDPTSAVTDYDFNLAGSAAPGTIAAVHDANGNPATTFPSYDLSGQPTEIRDPLGNSTKFGYDVDGLVIWIQDPNHAADTGDPREFKAWFDYDSFGRLGRQSAPKSTRFERGRLIWSGADFDPNDNVVRRVDPHFGSASGDPGTGQATRATYDPMDHATELANQENERTDLVYDAAGRLKQRTAPKGVVSATVDDFSTLLEYDPLNRVIRQTQFGTDTSAAQTRVTHLCYDTAGDLRSVTAPRAALATVTCPGTGPLTGVGFTSSFDYDAAHRRVATRDPLGHETRTGYDANGNPTSQEQDIATGRVAKTTTDYDQRDAPITMTQRLDGATGRDVTSRIEYDRNGNRSRIISPRANDAAGGVAPFTTYVTSYTYDAANRLTRMTLPFDARDGTERQYVHRAYDANGNMLWASLPVTSADPASVADSARTLETYFDPGWIRTSDDPTNPKVRFDDTAEGQQAERTPERKDAPGIPDTGKRMLWTYFADGQLKQRSDSGGQAATYSYDANNNLTGATSGSGLTDPSEQPVSTQVTYTGFDELAKTRSRKQGQTNWTFSDATYDEDGNVKQRRENGEETDAGSQTKAPRSYQMTYDGADWLTLQLDLGTDSSCAGDQRIATDFFATGWEHQREVRRGASGCTNPDPLSWPKKQTTTWTHFDNGLLRTLDTVNGAGTTTESHTVAYTDDSGIYVNGNRTSDHYVLKRGQGSTATTCVSTTAACDAKYVYDARDRLVSHQLRANKTNTYTYDQAAGQLGDTSIRAGNITTQSEGGVTTTRKYTANQLTEQTTNGATGKYWYDNLGNLDCVTTAAGSQADCSPSDGTGASANLVADNAYDYLNRLADIRYFAAGTRTDKTDYTYDALDRTTKEVEDHAGTAKDRTTTNTYQGLTNLVTQEAQAGGTDPKTKTYAYDAYGHRLGLTDRNNSTGATNSYSYGSDVHGSVSQLLDDAGSVKASYGYTAFGGTDSTDSESLTSGDTDNQAPLNPYRYTGKRMDSGTAASTTPAVAAGSNGYDMGARRFGPDIASFLQQDMFEGALSDLGLALDPLTQNRYALAGGNPISNVEIDGHMLLADGGGGGYTTPNPSTSTGGSSSGSGSGGDGGGGGGLMGALHKVGDWFSDHKAEVAGVAVGLVVGAACEVGTVGLGSVGCGALAGAAGNLTTYAIKTPASQQSLGGAVKEAGLGAVAGGVTAGLGSLAGKALSSLGSKVASSLGRAASEEAGGSSSTIGRVAKNLCNCFPAGAKVATADGLKPIQKIRVGDRVWARDLASGRSQLRQVTGLFHKHADRLLTISVAGAVIRVTPQHPFFSPDTGWVDAGHLKAGDRLLTRDGRVLAVKAVHARAVGVTVYNFEVAGDHNYYVSTAQLLVHNCDGISGSSAGDAAGESAASGASKGGLFKEFGVTPGKGFDPNVPSAGNRSYLTYGLRDAAGDMRYVGRASGRGTPLQALAQRFSRTSHHIIESNPDLELTPEILGVQGSKAANRGAEEFFYQGYLEQGAPLLNDESTISFRASRAAKSLSYIEAFFEEIIK
jgi:RHS repeat-associated protein